MAQRSGPLGIAVVGLGVGEQHAMAYAAHPGCALRWIYDLEPARMNEVHARLGSGRPAASFDQILGDGETDVISIASYDDAHFEQVVAGIGAGKHVFVEKPLCRSLHELAAIKRAWERAGRSRLGVNLVLRAAPLYRWLKQQLADGALGEVFALDGDYLYGRMHKITDGWRKGVPDYSVLQGGGVHLIDLMIWLTGQRPVAVSGAGNRICTAGTAFRYNDFAAATFRFPSGLVGRITANFGCVHPHQHVVRVFGTNATFIHDDAGARLHTTRVSGAGGTRVELAPLPATKGDLIPAFVGAVADAQASPAATQHEFDVASACVAADRAIAAGREIEIEYV